MRSPPLLIASAALVLAAAGPEPAPGKNPGDTPEYPTQFTNVGQPMDVLLSNGYKVAAVSTGLDTFSFVLEHDGKTVLCSVRNPDKPTTGQMLSQCFAMN